MNPIYRLISFLLLSFFMPGVNAQTAIDTIATAPVDTIAPVKMDTAALVRIADTAGVIVTDNDSIAHTFNNNDIADSEKNPPLHKKISFNKLHYSKTAKIISYTELNVLQQKVSYKTIADFIANYAVIDTADNIYTIAISVDKLNTEVNTMGVQMHFSSDSTLPDSASASFARELYDAVGKPLHVMINHAGVITGVDTSGVGGRLSEVISMLYSGNENISVGNKFSLTFPLADQPAIGDQWKDSAINKNSRILYTYTVKNFFRDRVIIEVHANVFYSGIIESNSKKYNTEFAGTQTGTLEINVNTGMVQSRKMTLSFEGVVLMGNEKIPARSTIEISELIN